MTCSHGCVSTHLHFWTTHRAHVVAASRQGDLGCSSVDLSVALCPGQDLDQLVHCGRTLHAFWCPIQPARESHWRVWFGEAVLTVDKDRRRAAKAPLVSLLRCGHQDLLYVDVDAQGFKRLTEAAVGQLPVRAAIEVEKLDAHASTLGATRRQ